MTEPTTPKEAAQWAWGRSGGIAENIDPDSIRPKQFSGALVKLRTVITDQQALKEFRAEWAALQKKNNVQVNVPKAPPAKEKTLAEQIADDARDQYKRWKSAGCKLADRGAWWGGAGPGKKSGGKAVPTGEIQKVTRELGPQWNYTDSRSGEVGWHKDPGGGKPQFIYHAKTPA